MKQLKKWYLNLSIQRKYLYCTLSITLVVLLAASFFQFMSASEIVTEQMVKQSAGVINELSVNLDHYFDMVENSFEYIANSSIVQEELESDKPYKSDGSELYSYYSRAGQIRRLLLQGYTSIYINDIQLYGYNGANHLLSNDRGINEESSEISCAMAENANGRCVYYNAVDENLIYMAKQIKDVLTMEPLGVLRASIKISYLKKMTLTAQESLSAHIFLLDQDNNILLESAGENMDLKDQKWVDQINGNSGNLWLDLDGKALYYIPVVISSVAICQIFTKLFSVTPIGIVNQILSFINPSFKFMEWISNPQISLYVTAFVEAYKYLGLYMVIFYAALIGVPDELGEAALIDGAAVWQEYLYVKIPYIKPVIIANCLLVLNGSLRSFEFSYLLTHGGPGNASELMTTYMYKQAFSSMKYGYGSAVAIMIVIICMVVGLLFRKFSGEGEDE